MTIEDDFLLLLQGLIVVAGPILIIKTINLWRGIIEGGLAKTQAGIAFLSDSMTILSIVACLASVLLFGIYAVISEKFKKPES